MKKTVLSLLALVLFTVAASLPARADDPAEDAKRPAVIFLPGYLGSFLRDTTTKERIFVTIKSALGRPGTLSLFQKELQTPAGPELEIDGVMDYVPAVFTKIDVYGSMIEQLKTLPNTQLITFDYDWRQDPYTWVQRLGALVDSLKAKGVTQIDLVAHSGGGWIASYYMAYGTQDPAHARVDWSGARNLRRVAMLGTPYDGGFALFREMERGSTLTMMGHLLPPDTMASFPSIYCTAPQSPGHLIDGTGRGMGLLLGDYATWKQYRFGLLSRTDLADDVMSRREAFTASMLAGCSRFMRLLQMSGASTAPASLSILSVVGTGTKTPDKGFLVNGRDGKPELVLDSDHPSRHGLDESLLYVDGDESVPTYSANLPLALQPRMQRITTKATHAHLTTDTEIQKAVLSFLK